MNLDQKYINRCLELAQNALPSAMPNPAVGAVVVFENQIIGEGYTSSFGGNHAEVNAINAVKDKTLLSKSTLYVSLEPCSHFGKTPPCVDLVLKYQIPNIVIGTLDCNPKVSGNGLKKLLENGKKVTVGVLETKCLALNKRFFTFFNKKRPYIILKWAASQDGFLAPIQDLNLDRKPVWISNIYSRQLVHYWRSQEDAILVGTQTVLKDNPTLTTRDADGKNPIRIVLDQNNRLPRSSFVFDNQAETLVITKNEIDFDQNIAQQIAVFLFEKNIQSVIVEGGLQTLQTFIDANIWDEARVFRSAICIEKGVKEPLFIKNWVDKTMVFDDELFIYYNHD